MKVRGDDTRRDKGIESLDDELGAGEAEEGVCLRAEGEK